MFRLAALASALSLAALPALAADGEQLFNIQCRQCHMGSIMGPSLATRPRSRGRHQVISWSPLVGWRARN